jgi:hypothetical protein
MNEQTNGRSSTDVKKCFDARIVSTNKKMLQSKIRFQKTMDKHQAFIQSIVDSCSHPTYYECKYLSSEENNHNGYCHPLRMCATCGLLTEGYDFGRLSTGENIGEMNRNEMIIIATKKMFHSHATDRDY